MESLTRKGLFHSEWRHLGRQDSPRVGRRTFLNTIGRNGLVIGSGWLTTLAHRLALAEETTPKGVQPLSLICLWLAGGPSQLETFDPHPDKKIAGDTQAISTRLPNVQLASGLERTAEIMDSLSLVRNMVSREADHARGSYAMKTGFSPELSLMHPSIGAIVCHALPESPTDLPRHISILGGDPFIPHQPARGGMLGSHYDAFHVQDPLKPIPNLRSEVSLESQQRRLSDLAVVEQAFSLGRDHRVQEMRGIEITQQAVRMMSSAQLKAFDVNEEPIEVRRSYGATPFGRGCLAARRLIESGARAVEVTLDGWDSHINNHNIQGRLVKVLDPALAALISDLRRRKLLEHTVVVCAGEFGRTPIINASSGRDHWNTGFSVAIAGGRIRPGIVVGETDPEGSPLKKGHDFAALNATILTALDLDPTVDNYSRDGRPVRRTLGHAIKPLIIA